jgi:ArsR family transcriptional regulator, arsenate/arsenite/antimonite-responsive transcriptional repressor / arsenate reductase (thioredoxin)
MTVGTGVNRSEERAVRDLAAGSRARSREHRAARFRALGDARRLAIVDALRWSDRTPSELSVMTDLPSNLLAFHLEALEEVGLVRRTPSEGDARRRYVRLVTPWPVELGADPVPDPASGAADGVPAVGTVDEVLFVCRRNASRSQLAAALWTARTGRRGVSAGSDPADVVDPVTVEVAAAHGLDLSRASPRGYDQVSGRPDLVVSVCDRAGEGAPPFAVPRLHWSVPDPAPGDRAAVETVHADLAGRVDRLAALTVPVL